MRNDDLSLSAVRECHRIRHKGQYVAAYRNSLWVFRTDGTPVYHSPDAGWVEKIAFLPQGRILISAKNTYYLLEPESGRMLWQTPREPNFCPRVRRFALTPDGKTAYDYLEQNAQRLLLAIDLENGGFRIIPVHLGHHCVQDLMCGPRGLPCFLETVFIHTGGKWYSENSLLTLREGERELCYSGTGPKWQTGEGKEAKCFLGSTDAVLTRDLQIYRPSTGELTPAFPGREEYLSEIFLDAWLDPSGRYMNLVLLPHYGYYNLVVDMETGRVAGKYSGEQTGSGCIVGGEYWISTRSGIVRRPFPEQGAK